MNFNWKRMNNLPELYNRVWILSLLPNMDMEMDMDMDMDMYMNMGMELETEMEMDMEMEIFINPFHSLIQQGSGIRGFYVTYILLFYSYCGSVSSLLRYICIPLAWIVGISINVNHNNGT